MIFFRPFRVSLISSFCHWEITAVPMDCREDNQVGTTAQSCPQVLLATFNFFVYFPTSVMSAISFCMSLFGAVCCFTFSPSVDRDWRRASAFLRAWSVWRAEVWKVSKLEERRKINKCREGYRKKEREWRESVKGKGKKIKRRIKRQLSAKNSKD